MTIQRIDATGLAGFSDLIRFDGVDWKTVPHQPGVCIIYDTDDVLYVGMAGRGGSGSLLTRLKHPRSEREGDRVYPFVQVERSSGRLTTAGREAGGGPLSLLTDLDGFYTEQRRCGELDGGVDDTMVWIACECGARMGRHPGERDALAFDA